MTAYIGPTWWNTSYTLQKHGWSQDVEGHKISLIRCPNNKKWWQLNHDIWKALPIKNKDKSTFTDLFLNMPSELIFLSAQVHCWTRRRSSWAVAQQLREQLPWLQRLHACMQRRPAVRHADYLVLSSTGRWNGAGSTRSSFGLESLHHHICR